MSVEDCRLLLLSDHSRMTSRPRRRAAILLEVANPLFWQPHPTPERGARQSPRQRYCRFSFQAR